MTDFPRDEDGARKMSEEKSTTCQGLIYAKILPLHVLPPSTPEKKKKKTLPGQRSTSKTTRDLDEL